MDIYATIAHAEDGTSAARTVLRLHRRKVVNMQTVYDCNSKPQRTKRLQTGYFTGFAGEFNRQAENPASKTKAG
jgi:hypothetical protein